MESSMNKVNIHLFDTPVAELIEEKGRIFLRQIDEGAHRASPISIRRDVREMETTTLTGLDGVAGFIHDALPGDYGNEIMDRFFIARRGKEPTVSERLLFIGDRALGALSFTPAERADDADAVIGLRELYEQGKELREGRVGATIDHFLVAAHSVAGGARSKAVVGINLDRKEIYIGHRHADVPQGFIRAIVKYDETDNARHSHYTRLEYVYARIAKEAKIPMAATYLLHDGDRVHFVTERFDHTDTGRYHVHSLAGLLHRDYRQPRLLDYDDLFRTATALGATKDNRQLYRQMLFNYLFVNQDDHPKNFSFMMDPAGIWSTTPAYDLTYANGSGNTAEHQMRLNGKAMSTADLEDFVAVGERHGIALDEIVEDIETMANLRETLLPGLMAEYEIESAKREAIIAACAKRTFNGRI